MFAPPEPIQITLTLPPDQAQALACFAARADYNDFERRTDNSDDAFRTLHAMGAVRRALKAQHGLTGD